VLGDNPLVESLVKLRAVIGQNFLPYAHACVSQLHNTVAGMPRIYIYRADNHIPDTSLEYSIGARSGAPFCGAWFEGYVQRGIPGHRRSEIPEAFNLSVIVTCSPMMSFRHNSISDDENRPNRWIGTSLTERLLCLVERGAHELFVSFFVHHSRHQ
jgi:hypothetical protein